MFDAFAEWNKGRNAETAVERTGDGKAVRKTYASIKAKTADKMQLSNARQMLENGASSEEVRKATGWFRGYDKKWRFEIDDSKMRVKIPESKYPRVGDMVEHSALFDAYPELKDIYVTVHDIENGRGSYSRTFGDIEISRDLLNKPEELKSVMAHELQHAVQDIEGLARGASLEYWEKKLVEGYDSRQAYVKAEEKALLDRIKQMRLDDANNDTYFVSDMEDLVKMTPDHPRGEIDWDTLEQIEEDSPQWKAFDKQRDALSKVYGQSEVFNFLTISSRLEQMKHKGERFAVDLYFDTAGEIEARDVQKRIHLDATERKNTRPDIDREDVVFAGGAENSYSLKVRKADGTETVVDPYEVTRKQVLEFMRMARKGELEKHTYFPVLPHTQRSLIAILKQNRIEIDDRPIAMQAKKARQSQIQGDTVNINGGRIRYHALTAEEIVEAIDNIGTPTDIIHQTNRTKKIPQKDGTVKIVPAPDNFAVFVKLENGKNCVVVIEFESYIDAQSLVIDGKGDSYHTTVTVFEPDVIRDGLPFDYVEYLLENDSNFELDVDITKENSNSETATTETLDTVSKKEFSNTSISQNAKKSTASAKKVSENSAEGGKSIRKSKDITPKVAEESGIEKSIGKLGDGKVESVAGRDAKAGARRAAAYSRRRQDMTVGQLRQMVARYTGEKVYTSMEARETIDNIYGIFTLSGKNRAKLYEALWQGYNSCKTDNERAEFSYDMAEYITVMMLAETSAANPDKAGALETLTKLKHGIGHLTFNESQRADLRHVLDKQGYKKFLGRWGFRETMQPNRRRVAVDVFIHNLGEENPEFAYLQEMTPQDAILELDRVYERTIEESKATVGVLDDMPDAELRGMIDDIGVAIYESFGTKGEKSTAEKVIEARVAAAEQTPYR